MLALVRVLPRALFSQLFGHLARVRSPRWLAHAMIRIFMRSYPRIDLSEAADPVESFPSLNEFFTRRLRPGARPLAQGRLLSPADGVIGQSGLFLKGQLLQAKGIPYPATALLGEEPGNASWEEGFFATVYLAPFNYHRVHVPVDGEIVRIRHLPGEFWPVNRQAVLSIPDLFAINERTWVEIRTDAGSVFVVFVAAMNVGHITVFPAPELGRRGGPTGTWIPPHPIPVRRGDELGAFEMGSTVVVLCDHAVSRTWDFAAAPRTGEEVRVGHLLAV